MRVRSGVLAVVLVTAGAAAGYQTARAQAPAFKTVHLLNVSAAEEGPFLAALAEMNEAIAETGYRQARYRVWRVVGSQQGNHRYIWEGIWPDRPAYDAIHKHPVYERASKRTRAAQDLAKDHVYNQYVEVRLPSRGGQ